MHFTRPVDLALAGMLGLGAGYALFDLLYDSMPSLPVMAGGIFGVLAIIEVVAAFRIREHIRGKRVSAPLLVARFVALAKASSMFGAIMLGVWVAALGYLFPRSGRLAAAEDDLPSAIVGAVCAAALIAAALWLEHCCRTPDPTRRGESDESEHGT